MIRDELASRFVDEFFGSWIYLEAMDKVAVDPYYYPGFNENLKTPDP